MKEKVKDIFGNWNDTIIYGRADNLCAFST